MNDSTTGAPRGATPFDDQTMEYWLTGRLSPARAQTVDSWLEQHPDEAGDWQRLKADQAALAVLTPVMEPRTLSSYDLPSSGSGRQRVSRSCVMVAFALGALCATLLLWLWQPVPSTGSAPPAFVEDADQAYRLYSVEISHPVEISGQDRPTLMKWLAKRLGRPLEAPDLGPMGFRLLGGRLLPSADGPAAQLMYENAQGERVTLYIANAEHRPPSSLRTRRQDGITSVYWIDGHWGYSLTGRLDRDRLSQLSDRIYRALSL